MVMRETARGEADACRQKAMCRVDNISKTFTANTTDEEKFQAYLKAFNAAVWGMGRCRENFEGENYLRWSQDKVTASMLHQGNEEGTFILRFLMSKMQELRSTDDDQLLCHVNGTKAAFMDCVDQRKKAVRDFKATDKVYHEKVICDRPLSEQPIIVQKLEAIIAAVMAHFVFISDLLVA